MRAPRLHFLQQGTCRHECVPAQAWPEFGKEPESERTVNEGKKGKVHRGDLGAEVEGTDDGVACVSMGEVDTVN